jgi:hypothetical protein
VSACPIFYVQVIARMAPAASDWIEIHWTKATMARKSSFGTGDRLSVTPKG